MLTERFEMRFSPELVAKIDEWRRAQPSIPSRAEAIRRLIEQALQEQIPIRGTKTGEPN